MKILLRADASASQGTGHVMRLLTLGEALVEAGHETHLATNDSEVPWLEQNIASSGLALHRVRTNSLDESLLVELMPDWLVVDSYAIDAAAIGSMRKRTKVLAVVDSDSRGIDADLFLDHNIGAEDRVWPDEMRDSLLAGSKYALVRKAIRSVRRENAWLGVPEPRVLAVMGGSDPIGMIVVVARALVACASPMSATLVCAPQWRTAVDAIVTNNRNIQVVEPTNDLPGLLKSANIAISAAGTSSWELCTLGLPSILIQVVDNQAESLHTMIDRGLVVGIDPTQWAPEALAPEITARLEMLLVDEQLRRNLSEACAEFFDGAGPQRVVVELERKLISETSEH